MCHKIPAITLWSHIFKLPIACFLKCSFLMLKTIYHPPHCKRCIQESLCCVLLCFETDRGHQHPYNLLHLHYGKLIVQYIPRNMHTVFALLCFVVVKHWLIFPFPSGLRHWHCGNLTIAPVPAKQPWWIWINTSCESIMKDCITTTKQSTTKPCGYFLGYTVTDTAPTGGTESSQQWQGK